MTLIQLRLLAELLPILFFQIRIIRILDEPMLQDLSLLCCEILFLVSVLVHARFGGMEHFELLVVRVEVHLYLFEQVHIDLAAL